MTWRMIGARVARVGPAAPGVGVSSATRAGRSTAIWPREPTDGA